MEAILNQLLKFVFNKSVLGTLTLIDYVQFLYRSMQHLTITITTQGYLEIPFEIPLSYFELLFFIFSPRQAQVTVITKFLISSLLDDSFSFFSPKGRSWMMCVLVMKFRKWLSCPGATYIRVCCVVGTTAPRPWRSWWCLAMSNLYCVRSGIHFFSILKLILSARIERICRRVLQCPALL